MVKVAVWEFEGDAVFDGISMYAEVAPRSDRALRTGTLEVAFTPYDVDNAIVVTNGLPERSDGAFEVALTELGAVTVACSNGGVDPVRLTTPNGFAVEGERIQLTLSWGEGGRVTVVNASRLEEDPDTLGAGFSDRLPLRARIRIAMGAPLTFGASHRGTSPYFHGRIHRATLTDSVDEPGIRPPSATVHQFAAHRRAPVRPRRVMPQFTLAGPLVRPVGALDAPGRDAVCIATAEGERPIGDLVPGDEILTRDHGLRPVRWIGRAHVDWASLRRRPHLRPVVIRKGALGQGLPEADVVLPPHHRLVKVEQGHQILVSAASLVGKPGVFEADALGVTYTHLLFEESEIYLANGIWVESFNPADEVSGGPYDAQRAELFDLFPMLRHAILGVAATDGDALQGGLGQDPGPRPA